MPPNVTNTLGLEGDKNRPGAGAVFVSSDNKIPSLARGDFGAGNGDRTRGLLVGNETLYH